MTTEKSLVLNDFNYELFSLVWLDSQVTDLPEYINLQEKLRTIINYLKIFQHIDQCEQYIRSKSNYDRVILIVNYQFAQEIVSRIHSLRQMSSIYVYGIDKETNKQWLEQYSKIKYLASELDENFLAEIQSDQTQRTHNKIDESFAISILNTNISKEQSTMELDNQFIYSQLLMDGLLRIEIISSDRTQFISLCREIYKDNKLQMNYIDDFEQTYSSDKALSWYTRDTFLPKILNKALCMQNIDILLLFRFFLYDIRQQLKKNQYQSSVRLYRSLFISNEELQILKDSIGGFISINTFFSTKFSRQLAVSAVDHLTLPDNLQRVLFEIDADSRLDNIKPFSTIDSSEILMMSGSIFRLVNIHLNEEQFYIIQMTLCSNNDKKLKPLFDSMKRNIGYNKEQINLTTFGNILWKMNKLDDAEKYYLHMIDSVSNDHLNLADLYFNLGHIYSDKNDYDSSLQWYNKSLEIWMKTLKSNDPDLANNYNAIATNYWKKGDYQQAYDSFNKALEIFQRAYDGDHISVAMCLNNMGTVVSNEKNYSKALNYYLKALTLFQKHLPTNHPNLGSLHCNNISTIYKNLNQIDSALEHLNFSLDIYEKSLPSEHPNIVMMLKNIAFLYEQKEDYQQALSYYKKISNIYHQTLDSSDSNVIQNEEKIQYLLSILDKKHSVN